MRPGFWYSYTQDLDYLFALNGLEICFLVIRVNKGQ